MQGKLWQDLSGGESRPASDYPRAYMKAKRPRNSSGSAKSKMGILIALFLQSIQKTGVKNQPCSTLPTQI